MTTVVLVVLALGWGAVLVFWLRSRSQGSFGDSVGLFHRHLHVLGRAAPGTLAPANRLRVPAPPPVPLSARIGARPGAGAPLSGLPGGRPSGFGHPNGHPSSSAHRRQVLRRRRDVLFVLVVAVVVTMVLAVATRARDAVYLQLLVDAALASYVALLVRLRNLAAERDLKLRVLQRPAAPAPARRAPRRVTQPAAYAIAGGYGDLALRRAVGH